MDDNRIDKAVALVQLHRYESARELLGEVLAGAPDNVQALALLGQVAYLTGDHHRAVELATAALGRAPMYPMAWMVRTHAESSLAYAEQDPVARAELFARAQVCGKVAVEAAPGEPAALRALAVAQTGTDVGAALETLDAALAIAPDDVGVWLTRAEIVWELFNMQPTQYAESAEAAYRDVLRVDSEQPSALYRLGRLAHGRGDRAEAAELLRRAAQFEPSSYGPEVRPVLDWMAKEDVQQERARLAAEQAAGKIAAEEAAAARAAEEAERARAAEQAEAVGAAERAAADRAVAVLSLASKTAGAPGVPGAGPARPAGPVDATDPAELAVALVSALRGCNEQRWAAAGVADIERAIAELRELAEREPENVDALHELALTDWLCGRWRTAITRLRKVARLDPERAEVVRRQIADVERDENLAAERKVAERKSAERKVAERKAAETVAGGRDRPPARPVRADETELERAAGLAADKAEARARRRRRREARSGTGDLDAATRVRRPFWKFASLLLLLIPLRLALSSCSDEATTKSPPPTSSTRYVPLPDLSHLGVTEPARPR